MRLHFPFARKLFAFFIAFTVLLWSIWVMAGYAADRVISYAGPTPMALDTAVCLSLLSCAVMVITRSRMGDE